MQPNELQRGATAQVGHATRSRISLVELTVTERRMLALVAARLQLQKAARKAAV